jgi:Cdc6-like AAA superfamily ATPase
MKPEILCPDSIVVLKSLSTSRRLICITKDENNIAMIRGNGPFAFNPLVVTKVILNQTGWAFRSKETVLHELVFYLGKNTVVSNRRVSEIIPVIEMCQLLDSPWINKSGEILI